MHLPKQPFYSLRHKMLQRLYAPSIGVETSGELLQLGTKYGGWSFQPSTDLREATIISCGLGEDASFDIELASLYGARVILIDPTPRAIAHYQGIVKRLGHPASQKYVTGGRQPATAYDLSKLTADSLILDPVALWTEKTRLKFFAPTDPDHVSHSIVDYQNGYSKSGPHIEVEADALPNIMARHGINNLPLLKLDIEGAEIEVIPDMLHQGIYPRQILVEFDEMNSPTRRSKRNVEATDLALRSSGYVCKHFDGLANFLYLRRNS
jgi:FkbM family methyltransferase